MDDRISPLNTQTWANTGTRRLESILQRQATLAQEKKAFPVHLSLLVHMYPHMHVHRLTIHHYVIDFVLRRVPDCYAA